METFYIFTNSRDTSLNLNALIAYGQGFYKVKKIESCLRQIKKDTNGYIVITDNMPCISYLVTARKKFDTSSSSVELTVIKKLIPPLWLTDSIKKYLSSSLEISLFDSNGKVRDNCIWIENTCHQSEISELVKKNTKDCYQKADLIIEQMYENLWMDS